MVNNVIFFLIPLGFDLHGFSLLALIFKAKLYEVREEEELSSIVCSPECVDPNEIFVLEKKDKEQIYFSDYTC